MKKDSIGNKIEKNIQISLCKNIKNFICDAETTEYIQQIFNGFNRLKYEFNWSGSAGLAGIIAKSIKTENIPKNFQIESIINIVVIGTTNDVT